MKFTKEQRHEIYKKALVVLKKYEKANPKNNKKYERWFGLCNYINLAISAIHGYEDPSSHYNEIKDAFPEFMSIQPTTWDKLEAYWWDEHDYAVRKKALNKCIKETAPKPKSK